MLKHAVILAAGFGSRLAAGGDNTPKPLRRVAGQSLIRRNLGMLKRAGIEEVVVVVGFRGDLIQDALAGDPLLNDINVRFAENRAYDKANGVSVLTAQPHIQGRSPYLLLMADHVFEQTIFDRMARLTPPKEGAILGIDRKINQVFDLDDATKVVTENNRIISIGKMIPEYNAVDVGMFTCSAGLFDALDQARERNHGDCSLSDGVSVLCDRDDMFTHDIGFAFWQDVDTDDTLRHAESVLRRKQQPIEGGARFNAAVALAPDA